MQPLTTHWSQPTPTQRMRFTGHALHSGNTCPFIGHSLHPHNTCLSLATPCILAILAPYWSQPTPTQHLPFTGHTLHSGNACPLLVTTYTHTTLAFHWPHLVFWQHLPLIGHNLHPQSTWLSLATPSILFSKIVLLILLTTGCICHQHPPGSQCSSRSLYAMYLWFGLSKCICKKC